MFSFFKKKPTNPTFNVSLYNYPEREILDKVINSMDNEITDPKTNIKIVCTLTKETLAERKGGKWEVNWYAEGVLANTFYALEQFKMA